ncbi:MAG: response regulator [Rhodospirillaceae bacterium]
MASVLVVDDHPAVLKMMRQTVCGCGHLFFGAKSGEECLIVLRTLTPEIIFLDIDMPPGINGYETCRIIRNGFTKLSNVPIIFSTVYNAHKDVIVAMQVGGNDFITKPFRPETIIKRIKKWLSRQSYSQASIFDIFSG